MGGLCLWDTFLSLSGERQPKCVTSYCKIDAPECDVSVQSIFVFLLFQN